MNRPSRPCEESEDYSLADCINQGMARQIGCQAFWSNFSGIPFCQDWGRLRKYIKAYVNTTLYLLGTFDKHGCLDPCTYIEYQVKRFNETFKRQNYFSLKLIEEPTKIYERKLRNTKTINITRLKIMFGSPTLQIEREKAAFPFSSLVAECGGTLGLFIGFNFLMIWEFFMFLLKLDWNKMKNCYKF